MIIKCKQCNNEREIKPRMFRLIQRKKFTGNCKSCSLKGNKYRLGTFHSKETRLKMRLSKLGKKKSPEHCLNISKGLKGRAIPWQTGENNHRWVKDRTMLKDDHRDRGGSLHREWSKQVKARDNWKCKINNEQCLGRLESHHILGWTKHPELRYEINNGITLCHFHHPRKKEEEKRLSPYFQELLKKTN